MPKTEGTRLLDPDLARLCLTDLDFGLIVVGPEGEVRFLNRRAEDLLETRGDEVAGSPAADLFGIAGSGPHGLEASVWKECSLPPTLILAQRGEKELTLECRMVPLGRRPRPEGGLLMFEDASESADEEQFQRNIDRFSSIGNLSAVIAHEIRNPLTGIRTTIQFVETKLPKNSPLKQDLEDSIKELDRIEQFTTDLLQFARPKISQLEETNINAIVEKVLSHVGKGAEDAGVQIKSEYGEELPAIPLDQDAVQQALLNIVLNALDAMPEGGLLRVTTSTRRYRSRRAVEVAVADTGTGIPEEMMEKIYDPFFTTRANGTGLGLSIALQIVKEHGGRVHVRNRLQGGAIFRLSFRVPEETEGTI